MLRIIELSEAKDFFTRKALRLAGAEKVVAPILEDIRLRGDAALFDYSRKFDQLEPAQLVVGEPEFAAAAGRVGPEFRNAMEIA